MAMPQFMKNPTTQMACSIGCLVIAAGLIVLTLSGGQSSPPTEAYYYDLNTGRVFVGSATAISPIETDSGPYEDRQPAGRRIYIFSCGGCDNYEGKTLDEIRAADGIPGWLEMYTPEAKKMLEQGNTSPEVIMGGQLVRAVDSGRWVTQMTSESAELVKAVRQMCDGEQPNPCNP